MLITSDIHFEWTKSIKTVSYDTVFILFSRGVSGHFSNLQWAIFSHIVYYSFLLK